MSDFIIKVCLTVAIISSFTAPFIGALWGDTPFAIMVFAAFGSAVVAALILLWSN